MTHAAVIDAMLASAASAGLQRHCAAWREPQPAESMIVCLIRSAAVYADKNRVKCGSRLGDVGVLGDWWIESLQNIQPLLDEPCGRLDRDVLKTLIRDMLDAEGVKVDDVA